MSSHESSYDSEEHRASYSTGNTTPEHDHAAAADKSQQEQGQEGPDVALFVKTDCYTRKRPTATGLASIRTALTHNNHNNNNNNNGHHSSGASSSSASISSLPESPTSTVVVVNDRSRIQTPASASASVASSVEIGAQVPFAPSNPNPDRPTPLFKSHSELVLPTRATTGGTATRTATEQQRAYKPAQAIIASPTTTTTAGTGGAPAPAPQNDYSMNQFPYIGASEETRRYNYSVPSSPTSSGYTSPIPRQIKEPKTPLYVPAVLRTKSQVPSVTLLTTDPSESRPPTRFHWQPNHARKNCKMCARPFGLFERRHHCRKCGDIFCAQDSNYTVPLDHTVSFNHLNGVPSRACKGCADDYAAYRDSIFNETNNTAAGLPNNNNDRMNIPQQLNTTNVQTDLDLAASIPKDWSWSTF